MARANVYVDGFNVYYGIRRFPGGKWLDLAALARRLLSQDQIHRIRYFTARVSAWPHDPQQPARQNAYLRALDTISDLSIHYGQFRTRPKDMPLVNPSVPGRIEKVAVWRTEEKGSDVNLASHMLLDAFTDDFEVALVISNDSDLATPVEFVQTKLARIVGVANPHPPKKRSLDLKPTFFRQITGKQVRDCQFPATLQDGVGVIRKPRGWA